MSTFMEETSKSVDNYFLHGEAAREGGEGRKELICKGFITCMHPPQYYSVTSMSNYELLRTFLLHFISRGFAVIMKSAQNGNAFLSLPPLSLSLLSSEKCMFVRASASVVRG